MAHGITEYDLGYVMGDSTWHKMPNYICVGDRPVTMEEARNVSNYPIEAVPLFRLNGKGEYEKVNARALVRPDKDFTLVPSVGLRFEAGSNINMVNMLDEFVFAVRPDFKIESVGTLFGGATFFINMRVMDIHVKGDQSRIATNVCYCNPLGSGSHKAFAHSVRIVCNNTLKLARSQGAANKTLQSFRHTASAREKIVIAVEALAELVGSIRQHERDMNLLAEKKLTTSTEQEFMDKFLPVDPLMEPIRGLTLANTARDTFQTILGETRNSLETGYKYTAYSLLQGYTNWIDHSGTRRNTDDAAVALDGLVGNRDNKKQEVLAWLQKV